MSSVAAALAFFPIVNVALLCAVKTPVMFASSVDVADVRSVARPDQSTAVR